MFDADGTAVVIHAKADDYQSQPAGNAGDRIACGVIEKGGAMGGGTMGGMDAGTMGGGTMGGMDAGTTGGGKMGGMDAGTKGGHHMDAGTMPKDGGMSPPPKKGEGTP